MMISSRFIFGGCKILAVAAASWFGIAAGPVGAPPTTSVVELFTSQGCSSCPPADRLIGAMARDPHVVALSYPVDYWDYIGWKDTLASPQFTARQKAYASARGDGRIYTPQVMIDGLADAVGSDPDGINQAIKSARGKNSAMSVPIHLSETDGTLKVDVGAGPGAPAGIYVLRVAHSRTVAIGRGENSGRSVSYTNVVRAMHKLSDWDGAAKTIAMPALKGDGEGYVVLVQQGTLEQPGAILAAAKSVGF